MCEGRILTLDVGNSRVKASMFEASECRYSRSFTNLSWPELVHFCEDVPVDGAVCCTVGSPLEESLLLQLADWMPGPLLRITHESPVPIEIEYGSRSTLGLDRVAAAVGASGLTGGEGALVVDAGTAVTLDVVDADRFYCGNISPGLALRFKSLHEHTAALPLVDSDGDVPQFGNDTLTALRSGVLRGLAWEISGAFSEAASRYGASRIVMTGGDARTLLPLLPDYYKSKTCIVPELVAGGLLSIYKYNLTRGLLSDPHSI